MPKLTRRQSLSLIAVTAAGGALMPRAAFAQQAETSLMPGADVCVLTPEVAQGPYYFYPKLERTDITEGRPGVPTTVRLQVVDAQCRPFAGARVDLWHCDAMGLYSAYPNQGDDGTVSTVGETFMRGTQFADADGMVTFETVYPGWYRGRTTHLHFKVWLDRKTLLTGQVFFPDALSQFIYDNVKPYSDRGYERDTLNAEDSIAKEATSASYAYVKELADRYLVAMIIGVDPSAKSANMIAPPGAVMAPPASAAAPVEIDRESLVPKG